MTTLIETIKIAQVAARKAHDTLTSNLLTTLISEAEMVGKNDGNRAPTDTEVVATIKKFIKGAAETLDLSLRSIVVTPVLLLESFVESSAQRNAITHGNITWLSALMASAASYTTTV